MNRSRFVGCVVTAAVALGLGACSAPPEEDSEGGARADAISAAEAAAKFDGAKELLRARAGEATQRLGVDAWAVYAVKSKEFTGTILFALDEVSGEVRYAVLAGQRPGARSGAYSFALVNYDSTGTSAPTANDKVTLAALMGDVASLKARLDAIHVKNVHECAEGIALIAVGALAMAAGTWMIAAVPTVIAGATWITTVLDGVAITGAFGGTVVAGISSVNLAVDIADRTKSCGALL